MPWQNVGSPFVVISPIAGIILIYNGTPALGTLAISIVASSDLSSPPDIVGSDQYGNNYLGGTTYYGGASDLYAFLNENNGVSTYGFASGPQPSTFPVNQVGQISANIEGSLGGVQISNQLTISNGHSGWSTELTTSNNGTLQATNSNDGNVYNVGTYCDEVLSTLTIATTGSVRIFTVNMQAGQIFRMKFLVFCSTGAAAGNMNVNCDGSAGLAYVIGMKRVGLAGSTPAASAIDGFPSPYEAFPMTAGGVLVGVEFDGIVSCNSGGQFTVFGNCSNAADNWSVFIGSYCEVTAIN